MALLTLELGALADPPSQQLGGLIKDQETLRRLDLYAKSITVCIVNGFVSHSAGEKARDKFMRKVKEEIDKQGLKP